MDTLDFSEMAKQILIAFEPNPDSLNNEPLFVIDAGASLLGGIRPDGTFFLRHDDNSQQIRVALNELRKIGYIDVVSPDEYRITDKGITAYRCLINDGC